MQVRFTNQSPATVFNVMGDPAKIQNWYVLAKNTVVDEQTAELRGGLAAGRVSTIKPIEHVIRQLDHTLGAPEAEWTLGKHLETAPEGCEADLGERGRRNLAEVLRPALQRYRDFLEAQVLPAARDDARPGLASLPIGAACYEAEIRRHTTLDTTAEAVHQVTDDPHEQPARHRV